MLVITFDEHGGFFDHVSPPGAVPTGDDYRYATPGVNFSFNRLGVRVPGIVVSAFTKAGTVVGTAAPGDPAVFDHASVLATAELRFALGPLTARDASAMTLDAALNLAAARTDPVEAPIILPSPAAGITPGTVTAAPLPAPPGAPLSANQKSFVALATACSLHMAPVQSHPAIWAQHMQVKTQRDAALYIADVETKIAARRAATASAKAPDPSA